MQVPPTLRGWQEHVRFGHTQQYLPRAGTTRATPAVCKLHQVQLCRLVLPRTPEGPRLPRQQEPSSQPAEPTPSEDTGRSRPELALCIPKAGHVGLEEVAGWPPQPQRPLASGRRPLSLSPAPRTLLNVPWEGCGAAWVQAHARRVSSTACVVWAALPTSGPAIEASGLRPPASAPRSHPKVSHLDTCSDGPSVAPGLRPTPGCRVSPTPTTPSFHGDPGTARRWVFFPRKSSHSETLFTLGGQGAPRPRGSCCRTSHAQRLSPAGGHAPFQAATSACLLVPAHLRLPAPAHGCQPIALPLPPAGVRAAAQPPAARGPPAQAPL